MGRGTKGGAYAYVVEGSELVHVREYATKRSRSEGRVVYEVPVEKVRGKVFYLFDFTRAGRAYAARCRCCEDEGLRWERAGLLEDLVGELSDLKFRVKSRKLRALVSELYEGPFARMAEEVKAYAEKMGFELAFAGPLRLEEFFRSPELHYFSTMCLPSDKSRAAALKVARRWVYELWVLKALCECLGAKKFVYPVSYDGKPCWWVRQASYCSTCVAETPLGTFSFWLEFQLGPHAQFLKMLSGKREAVRPDLVAFREKLYSRGDVAELDWRRAPFEYRLKKPVELLVECKEDPFEEWEGDVERQILQYKEKFKPKLLVVASLKEVPAEAKALLKSRGIEVVDELAPGSESVGRFCEVVRRGLAE